MNDDRWEAVMRDTQSLKVTAEEFLQKSFAMLQSVGPDHYMTIGFTDIDGTLRHICLSLEDTYEWEEGASN